MTAQSVYELAAGIHVDHKRGPDPKALLHAISWKANTAGIRVAACTKAGRFVPPLGHADFPPFPHGNDLGDAPTPPRCEKCLLAKPIDIVKADHGDTKEKKR